MLEEKRLEERSGMEEQAPADQTRSPQHFSQDTKWRLISSAIWVGALALILIVVVVINLASSGHPEVWMPGLLITAFVVPPMVMIMASGGVDLSVGAVVEFVGIVIAVLVVQHGVSVGVAFVIAMLVALVIGVINGLLVGLARIHGAIVTLGMLALLRALSFVITDIHILVKELGILSALPESPFSWLLLILFVIASVILVQVTPLGRRPRPGLDGERESWLARSFFVGTPYILSSLAAGFAGVLMLGYLRSSTLFTTGRETDVILAVLLGGTPLGGGFGNVIGAILGVSVVVIAQNTLLVAMSPYKLIMLLKGILFVIVTVKCHLYYRGVDWLFRRTKAAKVAAVPESQAETWLAGAGEEEA